MKYLFYCDLNTISCSETELENIISENSNAYLRISDNLWALDVYKDAFAQDFQSVPVYYLRVLLFDFLNDDSVCFIQELDSSAWSDYVFPPTASEFLFEDSACD